MTTPAWLHSPKVTALRTRAARLAGRFKRPAKRGLLVIALLMLAGFIAAHLTPLPARLSLQDSTLIAYHDGHPAHVFLSEDEKWRIGIDLDELDPAYIEALLALEDQRFYTHMGVDPIAVGRAVLSNVSAGQVVSGASTITMQLVRMVEPRPRTLRSKLIESLRAAQLELRLSKREILAHYLRFVPYGRNIEGVDAASLAYFGHRADALSPDEIATLLAVPQAPNQRYPRQDHSARLKAARDQIAQELMALGKLPLGVGSGTMAQALALVKAQPAPDSLTPFPRQVPHLAYWLKQREPKRRYFRTTIDRGAQLVAERLFTERRAELASSQIHNGALVIVEHDSAQVRALVGNFSFDDVKHGGQLPGFALPRSTGSLLKPLILGMAIDEGLAHPRQLTADVPVNRGGYRPDNFDGEFAGLVRFDEALVRSLNLPFVDLTERLGVDKVLTRLRQLEYAHINPAPDHYGLSVAVGGVEASPLEVAALYTAMAHGGQYRPLMLLNAAPTQATTSAPIQALSPEASHLVNEALASRERPDLPHRAPQHGVAQRRVQWKTGTSNGLRDAWSVGSSSRYTVAVWLGNFSNASSPMLIGGQSAAPLMFDLIEALEPPHTAPSAASTLPEGLKSVKVCAYSGFVATPACEHTTTAMHPKRAVANAPCPYHQQLLVDAQTGERLTPACQGQRQVKKLAVVQLPTHVERWMVEQRRQLPVLPAWAPECAPYLSAAPPRISSPAQGLSMRLIPGMPTSSQRVPLAATSSSHNPLSWFVDGEFIGESAPGERLWWEPKPGEHDIVVMDESGRASKRTLKVTTL